MRLFLLIVFLLSLVQALSSIKLEPFRFLFNQTENCTESKQRDQLRKKDYKSQYDHGIMRHICSQVYVVDNENKTLIAFQSSQLLNALKHKRLAVTGDSLGLQFFVGLLSSLAHEEHIFSSGNDTTKSNIKEAMYTHYIQYNTTIIWCLNAYMKKWDDKSWLTSCGNQLINSDFIVLAYGAWYKPFYTSPYKSDKLTYGENQVIGLREFNTSLYSSREAILMDNPHARLIYRTHPHIGNIDEVKWNRCHFNRTLCNPKMKSDIPDHRDGRAWSYPHLSANWTIAQNKVLRQFVHHSPDAILLDWYHLSLTSFDYFNSLGVQTHSDSLHYCSEGLPRLASLLLQLALS